MPALDVITNLDDEETLVAVEREFRRRSRRQEERVIYYRRPRTGAMPGWIIWSDSQPSKRSDMIMRGFIPLPQFGRIHDGDDRDGKLCERHGPWGPILSRPGGPEQFPPEQVITFRWYRRDEIGSPNRDLGQVPVPGVRFPQLAAYAEEHPISEYPCPECDHRNFLEAVHLARHLRNSHDWDRADILGWGTSIGIDFAREYRRRTVAIEIEPDDAGESSEAFDEPELAVEVAVAAAPVKGGVTVRAPDNLLAALE